MLSTEFFVIRPKEVLSSLLAEIGDIALSEFDAPIVWSQRFDLKTTGRTDADRLITNAVKLKYLAYATSQLGAEFSDRFADITPDLFDALWTIEWIRGGMIEEAEIYGDLSPEIVSKITVGSLVNQPHLATELQEAIERLRARTLAR